MSDIKERLQSMRGNYLGDGYKSIMVSELLDHIAALEKERDQYRMAAECEAQFADEFKAKIAYLVCELQYIVDDCADPSPPSYGAIKQAATQAIRAPDLAGEKL